jgi:hypothetical protein
MAEYILNGRVIAIDEEKQIDSKQNPGQKIGKRKLYLDCSRYDSLTGEKLNENTPLLDFGGQGLQQLNQLVKNGLKKGDIVSVKFAVDGRSYKDAQGKAQNFTGIRPYAIELYQRPQRQQTQQVAQPAQQQTQQVIQAPTLQQAVQQGQQYLQQQQDNNGNPVDDGLPF